MQLFWPKYLFKKLQHLMHLKDFATIDSSFRPKQFISLIPFVPFNLPRRRL